MSDQNNFLAQDENGKLSWETNYVQRIAQLERDLAEMTRDRNEWKIANRDTVALSERVIRDRDQWREVAEGLAEHVSPDAPPDLCVRFYRLKESSK